MLFVYLTLQVEEEELGENADPGQVALLCGDVTAVRHTLPLYVQALKRVGYNVATADGVLTGTTHHLPTTHLYNKPENYHSLSHLNISCHILSYPIISCHVLSHMLHPVRAIISWLSLICPSYPGVSFVFCPNLHILPLHIMSHHVRP